MKQYLELLSKMLNEGIEKESGRINMPNTIGISQGLISHDLQKGFPLLTTKKMYYKGIIHELLWFLRGNTNIKYLVDNNVHIWDQDAYRWYLKKCESWKDGSYNERSHYTNPLEFNRFISLIKDINHINRLVISNDYTLGDLGKVYGYQWRNQNGVDQIAEVLEGLKTNPYSRYHIIDGWNKADFKDMALPPCHLLYQFIVRPLSLNERNEFHSPYSGKKSNPYTMKELDFIDTPKFYLDLNMYQRSCDTFLGVPFNIASIALLNLILAKTCNMIPGIINWIGGDTHLYVNHMEQVKLQLSRKPMKLCSVNITKDLSSLADIENLTLEDFEIINYVSHPAIKAELSTGLKKIK
jgi:thymidylate synthase